MELGSTRSASFHAHVQRVGAAWLPAVAGPAREAFLALLRDHLARASACGRPPREPGPH